MDGDGVVELARDLIRIDTTNTGDPSTVVGERDAAEYVAARLTDAGYQPSYVEPAERRGNVVARLPGADPARGALLVHAHLDVVPADAALWSVPPFSGEVAGGYLWGRGAVDMKHMAAMALAVATRFKREGTVPGRDIVFAFFADEEAGGWYGARWLVDHRPDLFAGVSEALGEVGGFSVTAPDGRRAYLVQTAEKGAGWLRLRVRGAGGHGSLPHQDNPAARLAAAVARLDRHRFPTVPTDPERDLLAGLAQAGVAPDEVGLGRLVEAAQRDTANVTMLRAGYASNVVPTEAEATVDCRFLPGREEAFRGELAEVLGPEVEITWDSLPAVQADFAGPLAAGLSAAIRAEDPDALVLPYLMPAATDAKSLQRLGISHLGCTPLRLPPGFDFLAMFHGVDERVPVDALHFGTRVLERLLRTG
ncbi:MAG: M20/M25/M40 family metallo-hydrolase [Micromonosporaceae bacterium]|nr:M20/M25/M40 family metallo-hydrolase [Micromonosporaceae bacterium]